MFRIGEGLIVSRRVFESGSPPSGLGWGWRGWGMLIEVGSG